MLIWQTVVNAFCPCKISSVGFRPQSTPVDLKAGHWRIDDDVQTYHLCDECLCSIIWTTGISKYVVQPLKVIINHFVYLPNKKRLFLKVIF